MKKIYFLRHAHSESNAYIEDIDRPISVFGKIQAAQVAKDAFDNVEKPEFCFVSSAQRAQETAKYFQDIWQIKNDHFIITSDLYDFQGRVFRNFIYNLSEEWQTVMLVGHNFAISNVVKYFADSHVDPLAPCTMVCIEFDCKEWYSLRKGTVTNIFLSEL